MYKKMSANCNFESMKIDISMEPEFDLRISTSSVLSNRAKNLTPEHWNNLRWVAKIKIEFRAYLGSLPYLLGEGYGKVGREGDTFNT